MGFLQSRYDKTARIRPAEINAAGWNGLDDVVGVKRGVFFVSDCKRLDCAVSFLSRLQPHSVRIPVGCLGSTQNVLFHLRPKIAHRLPVAFGGGGKKWLTIRS